jgi:hypothetical protein
MRVRFQADADFNEIIIRAVLRHEPGIDFQGALAADLPERSDPEVLAIASAAGRVLVSHDRKSMPTHFAEFITRETSAGLLIVPQHLAIARVVEDLVTIWTASDAEEWVNRIYALPL